MKNFYSTLANVYGEIFPLMPEKISFLEQFIDDKSEVLDLACGIGTDASVLALRCNHLIGVDLEQSMLAQAPDLANADFYVMDMLQALTTLDEKFDLIYCVGNSLVHLATRDDVRHLLKKAYESLNSKGTLVLQIINYDRIIDQGITSLPTIEFKDGRFKRDYCLRSKKETVDFNTTLEYRGQLMTSNVVLLALCKAELEQMLIEAGFKALHFFGSFGKDKYQENSFHIVVQAQVEVAI